MNGTLYGVGVGPGDPRLMTYLAVDTIKCCPVLAVPADGKGKAVAYRIASGIVKNLDQKECLDLATPMTKDRAVLDAAYQTAADRIIEKLEQGLDVACLTLGDPTIYSTYIYIHRLVKARGYDARSSMEFRHSVLSAPDLKIVLQTVLSRSISSHLPMESKMH